jgi:hypothetical protein
MIWWKFGSLWVSIGLIGENDEKPWGWNVIEWGRCGKTIILKRFWGRIHWWLGKAKH